MSSSQIKSQILFDIDEIKFLLMCPLYFTGQLHDW